MGVSRMLFKALAVLVLVTSQTTLILCIAFDHFMSRR